MVVIPLPNRDATDPHALLFDSDAGASAVMFRGQWRDAF
jgi:hypothetical protein